MCSRVLCYLSSFRHVISIHLQIFSWSLFCRLRSLVCMFDSVLLILLHLSFSRFLGKHTSRTFHQLATLLSICIAGSSFARLAPRHSRYRSIDSSARRQLTINYVTRSISINRAYRYAYPGCYPRCSIDIEQARVSRSCLAMTSRSF